MNAGDVIVDWLSGAWGWLMAQYVNWPLVLRFIEVLIWPLIALIGLIMIRPGRIVDALLENGGELGLGPANLKFAKKIDEISAAAEKEEVENGPPGTVEPPAIGNPLEDAADPYTTVLNGWGKVVEGLEEAVKRAGLPAIDKRNPMDTVTRLRRRDVIGRRLEQNIREVWDFRNRAKHAGSRRIERLGLTQLAADDFYGACVRVRRSILRAVAHREANGSLTVNPPLPTSELPQPGAPLN